MSASKIINNLLNNYDIKLLVTFYVILFIFLVIADIIDNKNKFNTTPTCPTGQCNHKVGTSVSKMVESSEKIKSKPSKHPKKSNTAHARNSGSDQSGNTKVVQPKPTNHSESTEKPDSRATAAKIVEFMKPAHEGTHDPTGDMESMNMQCCVSNNTGLMLSKAAPYPGALESPMIHSASLTEAVPKKPPTDGSVPKPYNTSALGCSITADTPKTTN